jgi:hypothetical protein
VIAGRYDRLLPLEFLTDLAAQRLGVGVEVVDSGHLPALSVPEMLVRQLRV